VNENDMYRVRKVEQLIERDLPKLSLPEGFGAGPVFDPTRRDFGRGGKGGGGGRSGGGRPGAGRQAGGRSGESGGRDRNRSRGARPEGTSAPRQDGSDRPIKMVNHTPRTEGESVPRVEGQEGSKKPNRNRNRNRDRNRNQNKPDSPNAQGNSQQAPQENN
jgi:ATP-dependent RNA helicase RhlE